MLQKKRFTPEQAFQKIKHYCSYQERAHSEVKEKLYGFGLWKNDVETLLARLIEENYLNEERFARLFAGGRFRMKHWGRIKIRYELKQKQVSEYCISRALKEISEEEYLRSLQKLSERKLGELKSEKNIFIKKRKLMDFLMQKGYEYDLIMTIINEL